MSKEFESPKGLGYKNGWAYYYLRIIQDTTMLYIYIYWGIEGRSRNASSLIGM